MQAKRQRLADRDKAAGFSQTKQGIRERVWSQLEHAAVAKPGVSGYIPAFD